MKMKQNLNLKEKPCLDFLCGHCKKFNFETLFAKVTKESFIRPEHVWSSFRLSLIRKLLGLFPNIFFYKIRNILYSFKHEMFE